jgi:hypothetical protein
MHFSSKKTVILFFCASVCFFACKKSSPPAAASSDFSILVSGKWQLTAYSVAPPGSSSSINAYSLLPSCFTDNYYIFNADSTLTIDEGATKCDASAPQTTVTGDWKLLANNTQLSGVESVGGTNSIATVIQLNNSTLVLQDTTTYIGTLVNATATFTHIH